MELDSKDAQRPDSLKKDVPASPVNPAPPPLPVTKASSAKPFISVLLSLFVSMFLIDAAVSLLDDSLILFFETHALTGVRSTLSLVAGVAGFLVYSLMGLTLWIPKRLFLPLALFNPIAGLVVIPFLIYAFNRIQQVTWAVSFYQVLLGLVVLFLLRRRRKLNWPLIPADQFQGPFFNWRNVWVFHLVNIALVPFVAAYLLICAGLAVNHFSDGFVALRAEGLTVQVRKYERQDGKTILLVPMAHIGENSFYRKLLLISGNVLSNK